MKGSQFTQISNFSVVDKSFVFNGVLFSKGSEEIIQEFFTPEVRSETGHIWENPEETLIAIDKIDYPLKEDQRLTIAAEELRQIFYDKSQQLNYYLGWLWFAKDNCIQAILNVARVSHNNQSNNNIWRNMNPYCTADGEFSRIENFSVENLIQATKIYSEFEKLRVQAPPEKVKLGETVFGKTEVIKFHQNLEGKSRLERAIDFISTARRTVLLQAKIANYMSALECLFSLSSDAVSFRVSLATGLYYSSKSKNLSAEHVFNKVKEAYDLRSLYLHGGKFKKKNAEETYLKELSCEIDSILRVILTFAILEDGKVFTDKDDHLSNWIKKMTFDNR